MSKLKPLKVSADPRFPGGHPYHQTRYIVTADCVFDHDVNVVGPGSIIAKMTDCPEQPDYARLFSASTYMLEALEWAAEFAEGSRDINPALNNPKFNEWLAKCRAALAKAKGES